MSRLKSRSWKPGLRNATTATAVLLSTASTLWGQTSDGGGGGVNLTEVGIWTLAFGGSIVALVFAYRFFKQMMAADEGNERMVEIAGYVREGANAYLRQQYIVVAIFFVLIVIVLGIFAFVLERAK